MRQTLLALAIALVTVMTFAAVRNFNFVNYDDGEFVVENPHVAGGLSPAAVRWAFTHPYDAAGGPLTWLSHMADVEFSGLDAGAHHVTSLTIHVLSAVALFLVLHAMTRDAGPSALAAVLFAVHPLHVESVAWVAARKDVLSGLFWMLCIWYYAGYVRHGGARRYLLAAAAFAAGLLAKPIVTTLPAILLLLDGWPLRRFDRRPGEVKRAVLDKIPLVLISVVATAFAFSAQQRIGAVMDTTTLPLAARLASAVLSVWIYVERTMWPSGLVPYYPYRTSIPVAVLAIASAGIVATSVGALAAWRRAPYITVGWAWYLIALIPVIGIVQVGGHGMADRATYLPLVGLFIIVAWGGRAVLQRAGLGSRTRAVAAVGLVAVCAVVSHAQAACWHDSVSLWQHAVAVQPDNSRAHANLGVALALAGDEHRAASEYELALRLNPNDPRSHNNLALILASMGRSDEAIVQYQGALHLDPGYANARINLANLLDAQGHSKEAIEQYRVLLELQPDNVLARANLAIAAGKSGDVDQGLREMSDVIRRQPSDAEWHFIAAMMWVQKEDRAKAIGELEETLRLNPAHQRAAQALVELRQK